MKTGIATKRIVFSLGSKGGTGKSTVCLALADWFMAEKVNCVLLDLDLENKVKGSLQHFYPQAAKINVNTPGRVGCFHRSPGR
jgi:cellulose biosynthesis protein BcsQ